MTISSSAMFEHRLSLFIAHFPCVLMLHLGNLWQGNHGRVELSIGDMCQLNPSTATRARQIIDRGDQYHRSLGSARWTLIHVTIAANPPWKKHDAQ